MKKTVRISESQLNSVIKKVLKEQEDQAMSTGPKPEDVTGAPEGEATPEEGPNFEEFLGCAKKLMDQGVTVGNLVDQLLDAQGGESEPEAEPEGGEGMQPDESIPSDNQ